MRNVPENTIMAPRMTPCEGKPPNHPSWLFVLDMRARLRIVSSSIGGLVDPPDLGGQPLCQLLRLLLLPVSAEWSRFVAGERVDAGRLPASGGVTVTRSNDRFHHHTVCMNYITRGHSVGGGALMADGRASWPGRAPAGSDNRLSAAHPSEVRAPSFATRSQRRIRRPRLARRRAH